MEIKLRGMTKKDLNSHDRCVISSYKSGKVFEYHESDKWASRRSHEERLKVANLEACRAILNISTVVGN